MPKDPLPSLFVRAFPQVSTQDRGQSPLVAWVDDPQPDPAVAQAWNKLPVAKRLPWWGWLLHQRVPPPALSWLLENTHPHPRVWPDDVRQEWTKAWSGGLENARNETHVEVLGLMGQSDVVLSSTTLAQTMADCLVHRFDRQSHMRTALIKALATRTLRGHHHNPLARHALAHMSKGVDTDLLQSIDWVSAWAANPQTLSRKLRDVSGADPSVLPVLISTTGTAWVLQAVCTALDEPNITKCVPHLRQLAPLVPAEQLPEALRAIRRHVHDRFNSSALLAIRDEWESRRLTAVLTAEVDSGHATTRPRLM